MTVSRERDEELMALAVALAARARRRTAPNPWVGAVIVRDGVVVGEGATEPPGGPHAEVVALHAAGDAASGATVYTTLEPCSHHGRTPPCADALIDAGVARVVVGVEDPDLQVAGTGIRRLRAAGISVDVGVGAAAVAAQLAPYLHHRRTGRPFSVIKSAISIDGGTAAADGTSQWITGPAARADAHEVRADSQAVVVGTGTALADRPSLTVRDVAEPPEHPPLRVLLDSRGRVPALGPLFDVTLAPTLVITTELAKPVRLNEWAGAGAKVEVVAASIEGVDLRAAFATLAVYGVVQALFEGGHTLHGSLLSAGLVDQLITYVGPCVLGRSQVSMFRVKPVETIVDAPRFTLTGVTQLGDDVRLDYSPASGLSS